MRASRSDVLRLMQYFNTNTMCSAHSHVLSSCKHNHSTAKTSSMTYDYAFEFKSSNLRFGRGVTSEVGQDVTNMNLKNVCLVTDANMVNLPPVKQTLDSLHKNNIKYSVYDKTRVEPTDSSFQEAIKFAKENSFDGFIAVGGGSVIDTAKAANLYSTRRAVPS